MSFKNLGGVFDSHVRCFHTTKETFILLIIILTAGLLRFYNLMWGNGFFFHPDERNMATAVSQMCFNLPRLDIQHLKFSIQPSNCSLNPHFYAYGQFPLYLAYFTGQLSTLLQSGVRDSHLLANYTTLGRISFDEAIFWLRFWSAFSATLTVPLIYLITNKIVNKKKFGIWNLEFGHFAAILAATTPGLIQAAHFGTTESILTFFFMLTIYLSLKLKVKSQKLKVTVLSGIAAGLALASKLTAVYFIIPIVLAISLRKIHDNLTHDRGPFIHVFLFLLVVLGTFFLASPYNFLNFQEFLRISVYETKVAAGEIQTFYTRQFTNTTPLLFQIKHIFPFALGWQIFIFGILGLLFMTLRLIKVKFKISHLNLSFFIFIFSFLFYLLPNAFLFAKWTRFITPIFPFFAISAAYFFHFLFTSYQTPGASYQKSHQKTPLSGDFGDSSLVRTILAYHPSFLITYFKRLVKVVNRWGFAPKESWMTSQTPNYSRPTIPIITTLFVILSILPGFFFFQIYTRPDVRIQASKWLYENIPDNSYLLSETGNVLDIPLSHGTYNIEQKTYNLISFDFYHLDENPALLEELVEHLSRADYILVPSRRIFANHLRLPDKYPATANYYQALFDGRLGFGKISEITSFPNFQFSIFNFQFSDESAEETWTVFDHPVIRIFKKTTPHDKLYYQNLLSEKRF